MKEVIHMLQMLGESIPEINKVIVDEGMKIFRYSSQDGDNFDKYIEYIKSRMEKEEKIKYALFITDLRPLSPSYRKLVIFLEKNEEKIADYCIMTGESFTDYYPMHKSTEELFRIVDLNS